MSDLPTLFLFYGNLLDIPSHHNLYLQGTLLITDLVPEATLLLQHCYLLFKLI
jgi:hypothetical protein